MTVCAAGYALICLMVWGVAGGFLALMLAGAAALCVLYYRQMAYAQFGGVTGDLAGWLLQVTELTLIAVIIIGGKAV